MIDTIVLPARLDLANVRALAEQIGSHKGGDLAVDAGQVDHLGALGAQVLLAASLDWQRAGLRLSIAPRSPAFDETLSLLGLSDRFNQGDRE